MEFIPSPPWKFFCSLFATRTTVLKRFVSRRRVGSRHVAGFRRRLRISVSETVNGQPVAPLMGHFTDPDVGNARAIGGEKKKSKAVNSNVWVRVIGSACAGFGVPFPHTAQKVPRSEVGVKAANYSSLPPVVRSLLGQTGLGH